MSAPERADHRDPPARPLVIGHRGAPGYRPEHTRGSFLLAIAQGAEAIEVDVVPSRDGALIVRHDLELGATTDVAAHPELAGRRRAAVIDGLPHFGWFVTDVDRAELELLRARERFPQLRPVSAAHDGEEPLLRLEDALALAAAAGVLLVIEIKHATLLHGLGFDMAALVLAAVRDAAAAGPLPAIAVESFERTPLAALAAAGAPFPLVQLIDARGSAADVPRGTRRTYRHELADPAGLEGLAGVSVPISMLHHELVQRMAAHDLTVWAWTLRPENRFLPPGFRIGSVQSRFGSWHAYWGGLLQTGVAAVFADHPDLAVLTRDQLGGAPGHAAVRDATSSRRA